MAFHALIGPGRFIDPQVIQASAARGDDWYPYAARMPLTPEAASQPRRHMTTFLLHSMAGPRLTTIEALWTYLNRTDIVGECTWIGDLDGRVAQLVPVDTRADNNYKANPFATSIETQDRGSATLPTTPWSDPLMAQLAGLSAWQVLHPRLDIPLRRADRGWNGGGIDGHRRYPEWSSFKGKTCPGEARWNQIDDVLDGAQTIVDWRPDPMPPPDPNPPEDEMKRYLAVLDTNEWHARRGDGLHADVLRSDEYKGLLARFDRGEGGAYYRPETPGIDSPGELIRDRGDIPVLTESQLDLDVGYITGAALKDEG